MLSKNAMHLRFQLGTHSKNGVFRGALNYLTYDMDKKLVYRKNENNEIKQYVVSPHQMVASNGRYYLLCPIINIKMKYQI